MDALIKQQDNEYSTRIDDVKRSQARNDCTSELFAMRQNENAMRTEKLIGKSNVMRELRRMIADVAPSRLGGVIS